VLYNRIIHQKPEGVDLRSIVYEEMVLVICIVIPAYQPPADFAETVDRLHKAGFADIVVVDDGSGTEYGGIFARVEQLGCTVLRHSENMGKGAALKTAFTHLVSLPHTPDVLTMDCDGQHRLEDVREVADAMKNHPHAIVLGCRSFDAAMPCRARMAAKTVSAALRFLYGIRLPDAQSGLWGISGRFMAALAGLRGQRFEYELNILLFARKRDIELATVPIRTVYPPGASSHFRTVSDSMRVMVRLLWGTVQYSAAAALSAVMDVVLYCIFVKLLLEQLPLAVRMAGAAVIARTMSSVVNYLCNRRLPYMQNSDLRSTLPRYYFLWTVQLLASISGAYTVCRLLHLDEALAKLLVDLVLAVLSYQIQLRWVFAKPRQRLPRWGGFGRLAKRVVQLCLSGWRCEGTVPEGPCVYIAHHQNMYGPVHTLAALPVRGHIWALHVFTNRKTCFSQFYHYTFRTRFGWPAPAAWLVATVLSLVVPAFMRTIGAVPVYRGSAAVRDTMQLSAQLLARGESLVICPDIDYSNSSDEMGQSYTGFLMLEKYYYQRTGGHLPFVPVYCDGTNRVLQLGQPVYCVRGDKPDLSHASRLHSAELLAGRINEMAARRHGSVCEEEKSSALSQV